jgi:ferredoxin-NADP reductase
MLFLLLLGLTKGADYGGGLVYDYNAGGKRAASRSTSRSNGRWGFSMSSTISVALIHRKEAATGTTSFTSRSLRGFTFTAGQYISLAEIDPPEAEAKGGTRTFSIASAPEEAEVMITTRMRDSAFKRCLKTMDLGTKLNMEGPFGNLVLHADPSRPAVFLAGGIGVTPFRSIVVSAARAKLPHRLFLLYSNRRPEDAAFLSELGNLEEANPNYKFVATMTEMEKARSWHGETGRITKEMILQYLTELTSPIYYVAGPPGMVLAMEETLTDAGVNGDHLRTEEFFGY